MRIVNKLDTVLYCTLETVSKERSNTELPRLLDTMHDDVHTVLLCKYIYGRENFEICKRGIVDLFDSSVSGDTVTLVWGRRFLCDMYKRGYIQGQAQLILSIYAVQYQ